MSTARHHAEWLSLVEVSGPFLSLPVLLRVFPQGLDAHDPDHTRNLRLAYEEWDDNQGGLRPDPAIHRAWIRFVLGQTLGFPEEVIAEGQALPPGLEAHLGEHGETLRPDLAIVSPQGLPDAGKPRLLLQVYPAGQGLERAVAGRIWKASPATRMMELLHACDVPLGLVTNGEHWLLVYAPRGETTGYASWYSALWLEEPLTLRAFRSLLGAQRFFGVADADTLGSLFKSSSQDQQEVTDQLGYQVRKAVEVLVQAIDRIDKDRDRALLRGVAERRLYEAALTTMMRLVFLFSAEERELLLLGDPIYDQHYAVSTLRAQLREAADQYGEEVLERRHDAWSRLLATFRAVYGGISHERLSLPPYGGNLFDPDRFPFLEGREPDTAWQTTPAQPLPIHNRTVLHLLEALQILQVKVPGGGPAEPRRLSFRALDIEQIGHVYEGLLDHTAVRAVGPVLGLAGTKDREPELPLERLEELRAKGDAALLAFLKDETGRSESALRNALSGEGAGKKGRRPAAQSAALPLSDPPILPLSHSPPPAHPGLLAACDNDEQLYHRALPFAGLLREDTHGCPAIITAGSVYVTQGSDRRTTGTHYTPRSLTESIVQHTLDPLVYAGPAEGKPKDEWRLRSAREILELKVCDPAMGSGAFLVQACRYLSERLVEAWETAEHANPGKLVITPEGDLSTGAPEERPLPRDPEERLALARRIVADHCLYGVDKNPMAVEMAKLSLWLITLAKGKPFTFLDHRLRRGDSLVGTLWREVKPGKLRALPAEIPDVAYTTRPGDSEIVKDLRSRNQGQLILGDAAPPEKVRGFEKLAEYEDTPEGQRRKADYYRGLREDPLFRRRHLAADLWCAAWFWPLSGSVARLAPTTPVYRAVLEQGKDVSPEVLDELARLRERIPFFHWALEFPDVSAHGGFNAVVGNPPFQGGQKITSALGTDYRDYLVEALANGRRGSADLCAYFFLQAGRLVRGCGSFGLLATNTIAQGDTRQVGLDRLIENQYIITRAVPSQPWPNLATVEVAVVWLHRGPWQGERFLDRQPVFEITSQLLPPDTTNGVPFRLRVNADGAYQGSIVLGMGFVLTPEAAHELVAHNPSSRDVLEPYINGIDLNSRSDHSASRWIINFRDWPQEQAEQYSQCWSIVTEKVQPERQRRNDVGEFVLRKPLPQRFWQYAEKRPALYSVIAGMDRVIGIALTSKTLAPAFVATRQVIDQTIIVMAHDSAGFLSVVASSLHYWWVIRYGASLRTDARYSVTDCFETFPFPACTTGLDAIGECYHEHRSQLMVARQEGLTKTYNRFHNLGETSEDIRRLRELHVEMDYAVAAAYGWTDLDLGHGFHETKQGVRYTLNEGARREVLGRLLKLNHERYAEEVAQGLHDKGARGRGSGAGGKRTKAAAKGEPGSTSAQRGLFDGQLSLGEALE